MLQADVPMQLKLATKKTSGHALLAGLRTFQVRGDFVSFANREVLQNIEDPPGMFRHMIIWSLLNEFSFRSVSPGDTFRLSVKVASQEPARITRQEGIDPDSVCTLQVLPEDIIRER